MLNAVLSLVILATDLCPPAPQLQGDHPKLGMYSEIRSNGDPYRTGTTIHYDVIATQAKWDFIVLDIVGDPGDPPADDNRKVMQTLRDYAPDATIAGFSAGQTLFACKQGWWWDHTSLADIALGKGFDWDDNGVPDSTYFPFGCDTSGANFAWARMKTVRAHNAVVYSMHRDRNNDGKMDAFTRNECGLTAPCAGETFGHPNDSPFINFAMPGISQALADTIVDWAQRLDGVYNGIFVDELCRDIAFWQSCGSGTPPPGSCVDSVDYTRSGHASLGEWQTAYIAGVETFLNRIKSTVPANWIVADNGCAVSGSRLINGHMRENFPNQNGSPATWTTNMLGWSAVPDDVGYLGDDDEYATPIYTTLLMLRVLEGTSSPLLAQSDLNAQRLHRLILGSATLGEGYGIITGTTNDLSRGYLPWWADEYAVTPEGFSTTSETYQGWLGDPLGDWFVDPGGGYRRNFEGGAVIVNGQQAGTRTFSFNPGYYRIFGSVCPTVNTGAAVTAPITLQPRDALFLQKRPPSGTP